jgi:hypothetical protein
MYLVPDRTHTSPFHAIGKHFLPLTDIYHVTEF